MINVPTDWQFKEEKTIQLLLLPHVDPSWKNALHEGGLSSTENNCCFKYFIEGK